MSERRLMSVQSELVRTTMVETIRERAVARASDPLPNRVSSVLNAAARPDLARLGYFMRVTETDLFEPAREPAAWLAEELQALTEGDSSWPEAVSELAASLADREPSERPGPDNPDAITWRIAGPGGHVRHYVAVAFACDNDAPALKRDVIYGFVARCCEEVVANPALSV
jgi:hypothetical protein